MVHSYVFTFPLVRLERSINLVKIRSSLDKRFLSLQVNSYRYEMVLRLTEPITNVAMIATCTMTFNSITTYDPVGFRHPSIAAFTQKEIIYQPNVIIAIFMVIAKPVNSVSHGSIIRLVLAEVFVSPFTIQRFIITSNSAVGLGSRTNLRLQPLVSNISANFLTGYVPFTIVFSNVIYFLISYPFLLVIAFKENCIETFSILDLLVIRLQSVIIFVENLTLVFSTLFVTVLISPYVVLSRTFLSIAQVCGVALIYSKD